AGRTGDGMETGESQRGRARRGRRLDGDDRERRRRNRTISGWNRAIAEAENVQAKTGAPGLDGESERKAEATGNSDHRGSSNPDGDVLDPGADLRGGFSGL